MQEEKGENPMNDLIKRVKRKMLLLSGNIKITRKPVIQINKIKTDIILEGDNLLGKFLGLGPKLFSNYNSTTKVLIKVNLNSALPYPASVSIEMLETLISSLKNNGVNKIVIADCSGLIHLPTSHVIKLKNLKKLMKDGVIIESFDFGKWFKVPIDGKLFKYILIPERAYWADKIINLSNLKSHSLAGFSGSIKNLVGFMHPVQRKELHKDHLVERIAEIPLAIIPDINIIDARKIFIDGGPDQGTVTQADQIIINSSLIEADKSAYNLLVQKKMKNNIHDLSLNYKDNLFFKSFNELKRGKS